MRILIIGAGAVGGYFGARLAAAGREVTFLVREHRAQQLRRTGLNVVSPHDRFTVQPRLLLAADLLAAPQTFDLILVSTKAYQLAAAMEDFAPAVGPQTMILPLLNGLAHLDALTARFGEPRVLGGSTRIVADLDADGTIHSMEALHDIHFGERDGSPSPRIQQVAEVLGGAGFDAVLEADILAFLWQKWTFLAALGAITCLLGGSIGEVVAAPGGEPTARAILAETVAISTANGSPTSAPFLQNTTTRLLKPGSTLTASMYRDKMRGGPVEADHILGDLLRRGALHHLASPLLTAAYAQLSVYQSALQQKPV